MRTRSSDLLVCRCYIEQAFNAPSGSRGAALLVSDPPLFRSLRRRQETYRLRGINPKRKAERQEAVQLAQAEVRWAIEHVRSLSNASSSNSPLSRQQRRSLIRMVVQMTRNEMPISYLLGSMPFGSLPEPLTVRPPVLLPRPETEHWATEVADQIANHLASTSVRAPDESSVFRIVDLCTGSGCIAVLVAHILRSRLGEHGWHITACDRSPEAVALAQENVSKLGFNPSQVRVIQADIFDNTQMDSLAKDVGGPFDVVLSNPPYIPRREWERLDESVRRHEDPAALIGEQEDGLAFHRRLAELLFRPAFTKVSTTSEAPNDVALAEGPAYLVAEYGKGQHRSVERIYAAQMAPASRLPRIVRVPQRLVIVGVGNASTHPLTKHSIGQVVLDGLLKQLIQLDSQARSLLKTRREQLEHSRTELIESGKIDTGVRKDWLNSVPRTFPLDLSSPATGVCNREVQSDFDPDTSYGLVTPQGQDSSADGISSLPTELARTTHSKSGGWSATIPMLVPLPSSHSDQVVYQIDVALYKPSQAMNLSGVGLKAFLEAHNTSSPSSNPGFKVSGKGTSSASESMADNVLVLQDELDLDFGVVKRKTVGSARGHNGIRDILARLKIPDSSPASQARSGAESDATGPRLARLRIGIGRPPLPHSAVSNSNDGANGEAESASASSSWLLPSSLFPSSSSTKKGGKQNKPIPIDKWVLSPLDPDQLESYKKRDAQRSDHKQPESVLDQVFRLTADWITERVQTLADSAGSAKSSPETPRSSSPSQSGPPRFRIQLQKDQFGVERTVWIH
ncbi:hypothetical protein BCV70DRAFT_212077 [Testicularia cyperi]|uniref:Methyltransferase domain-containing protein n=1 Tax=Testicularia cyperi TaxID=1882483 RepID=A0A317XNI6_9BASI|nr:hypothetical protein BCV70DRAFT_212077 [Testicularia cyperi]